MVPNLTSSGYKTSVTQLLFKWLDDSWLCSRGRQSHSSPSWSHWHGVQEELQVEQKYVYMCCGSIFSTCYHDEASVIQADWFLTSLLIHPRAQTSLAHQWSPWCSAAPCFHNFNNKRCYFFLYFFAFVDYHWAMSAARVWQEVEGIRC